MSKLVDDKLSLSSIFSRVLVGPVSLMWLVVSSIILPITILVNTGNSITAAVIVWHEAGYSRQQYDITEYRHIEDVYDGDERYFVGKISDQITGYSYYPPGY